MVGLAVGATRLVLEFLHPAPPCGDPDMRPAILGSIHYLHFAVVLFVLSGLVVVAGSLLTAPPPGGSGEPALAPDPDPWPFPNFDSGPILTPDPPRLQNFLALAPVRFSNSAAHFPFRGPTPVWAQP